MSDPFLDQRLDQLQFGRVTRRLHEAFKNCRLYGWGRPHPAQIVPLVTVRDLIAVCERDLLAQVGVGKAGVRYIKETLAPHGLHLSTNDPVTMGNIDRTMSEYWKLNERLLAK